MFRSIANYMLVVVSAVGIVSCMDAVGGDRTDGTEQESEAAQVAEASSKVEAPNTVDELLGLNIDGNEATLLACRVKLLFCRDPRHQRLPTYCSNGCTFTQAHLAAERLCVQTCGFQDGNLCEETVTDLGGC